MSDSRFDTSRDPRFKRVPKNVRRVEVDNRFEKMFTGKDFVEMPTVDAQGRKVSKNAGRTKLKEFYELADDPTKKPTSKKVAPVRPAGKKGKPASKVRDEEEEEDEEDIDEGVDDEVQNGLDDAEDEDEDEEEDEEEEDDTDDEAAVDSTAWERDDADVPLGDATKRFTLMGCDWDRVSAVDLLVMLRTYLKKGQRAVRNGSVDCVRVYPSDYGLQKLAEEAKQGPGGFDKVATPAPVPTSLGVDDDEEEANAAQVEALRIYQLQRTKYHYAVAECDSVATSQWLYDQLDGLEADGVCPGTLDLRFVPDDLVEFPHAPTSEATEVPKRYEAPDLAQKTSLGHTKVQCTWDEAPVKRKKDLMRKSFTPAEMRDADLEAYLASTSEEESDGGAEALRKLVRGEDGGDGGDDDDFFDEKNLEMDSDDDVNAGAAEGMGNMEATFSMSASKLEEDLTERVKKESGKAGGRVHTLNGADDGKPKTVWEQYLEKRKEKRRERRQQAKNERQAKKKGQTEGADDDEEDTAAAPEATEEDLKLLALDGEGADDSRGFNFRGKKRGEGGRAKLAKETDTSSTFKVNVDDPRIAKVFDSEDFQIDPTNPEYRGSEGMKAVLKKKRVKKIAKTAKATTTPPPAAADSSLPARAVEQTRGAPPAPTGGLQLFARKRPAPAAPPPSSEALGAATAGTEAKRQRKRNKPRPS